MFTDRDSDAARPLQKRKRYGSESLWELGVFPLCDESGDQSANNGPQREGDDQSKGES